MINAPDDETLALYLEDALDDAGREAVEAALRSEPGVAARLEKLSACLDETVTLPEVEVPERLIDDVLERVESAGLIASDGHVDITCTHQGSTSG